MGKKSDVDSYGHRLKAFSLRMEKALRTKLESLATSNGRTLTSEINFRLERSVIDGDENKDMKQLKADIRELKTTLKEMQKTMNELASKG